MSDRIVEGALGELWWNVSDAVLLFDGERLLDRNPAAERIFGDADLTAIFGEALLTLQHLVATGGTAELSCTEGCDRTFEAMSWRLGNDPSQPAVVILRDVTDARRHLAGLTTVNRIARELIASGDELPLQSLVTQTKELLGARFSALLKLREGSQSEVQDFVYDAPRDLFPARLPRIVGLLAVPIATGAPARLDDIRHHPLGVGIPVEHPPIAALLAVPVVGPDGVLGELAVANAPGDRAFDEIDEALLTELAALVALALTLRDERETTKAAEDERQALLGLALHNIRTPLTVVRGFVEALRTQKLDDEMRETAFAAIDRSLKRMQGLAEGALLDRWDKTKADAPAPAPVVPDELVAAVFEDVRSLVGTTELRYEAEPKAPATFVSDPRRLREALLNLVTNALRHAPGSPVVVTYRLEGDSVRFDVRDQGPGISETARVRLFKAPHEGSARGRGLWLTSQLMEILGGTIGVSSRPGEGSTFWVTVPAAAPG